MHPMVPGLLLSTHGLRPVDRHLEYLSRCVIPLFFSPIQCLLHWTKSSSRSGMCLIDPVCVCLCMCVCSVYLFAFGRARSSLCCVSFSRLDTQALECPGSVVVRSAVAVGRLRCPMVCGISRWTCIPCTGRWILSHWTAREVPIPCCLK